MIIYYIWSSCRWLNWWPPKFIVTSLKTIGSPAEIRTIPVGLGMATSNVVGPLFGDNEKTSMGAKPSQLSFIPSQGDIFVAARTDNLKKINNNNCACQWPHTLCIACLHGQLSLGSRQMNHLLVTSDYLHPPSVNGCRITPPCTFCMVKGD